MTTNDPAGSFGCDCRSSSGLRDFRRGPSGREELQERRGALPALATLAGIGDELFGQKAGLIDRLDHGEGVFGELGGKASGWGLRYERGFDRTR